MKAIFSLSNVSQWISGDIGEGGGLGDHSRGVWVIFHQVKITKEKAVQAEPYGLEKKAFFDEFFFVMLVCISDNYQELFIDRKLFVS